MLVYRSQTLPVLDKPGMRELIAAAQAKNLRIAISGFLLWQKKVVVQALLGERKHVEAIYAAILADPRHTNVARLFSERDDRATFPDWSMQYWDLDSETIADSDRTLIKNTFEPYQRTIIFAGLSM